MTEPNQGQRPSWYSGGNDDAAAGSPPENPGGQPLGGSTGSDHSQTAAQAGGYGIRPPQHPPAHHPSASNYPSPAYTPHGYAPAGYGYHSPTPGTDELNRVAFEREQQAQQYATTAVILGIVGLFTLPVLLGPLAIWQASKARSLGNQATAGLVLGWIALIWGFTGWLMLMLFMLIGFVLAF